MVRSLPNTYRSLRRREACFVTCIPQALFPQSWGNGVGGTEFGSTCVGYRYRIACLQSRFWSRNPVCLPTCLELIPRGPAPFHFMSVTHGGFRNRAAGCSRRQRYHSRSASLHPILELLSECVPSRRRRGYVTPIITPLEHYLDENQSGISSSMEQRRRSRMNRGWMECLWFRFRR